MPEQTDEAEQIDEAEESDEPEQADVAEKNDVADRRAEVELDALQFHISVLTPPVAMHFTDEQTLLSQLRPGIDGLVLRVGKHCGTFLPQVWESIPEPADFLRQLRLKAGLAPDHWSDSLIVERYQTESFGA